MQLIDSILEAGNLTRACQQVVGNKGAAGVDAMGVDELKAYLDKNRAWLTDHIRSGMYCPQPIRGKEIPKDKGKKRLLGIPTVVDRMLQQAVVSTLMPKYEFLFSEYSYGYRPKRNIQQAVAKAHGYIHAGLQDIVDIDLEGFFDEVDHCLLLQILYRKIKCKTTMALIRRWLRVPILLEGKLVKRRKGIPQGSPLSPLLSNIMLHELDTEMEKWGLKFVRYADDFSIYCSTKGEARKVGNAVYVFLRNKLKLTINREKSGIRRPVDFKILGFGFVPTYKKGDKGKYQLVVEEKRLKRLKAKLKEITRKTRPMSFDQRVQKLKEVQRGWVNNFKSASIYIKLRDIDGWVRSRLRYCIWHDWKKPERKRKNLLRLGADADHAYAWSRTRKGGWPIAKSSVLKTTVTVERLQKRGYESMLSHYRKVSPLYKSYPLFPIV